VFDLQANSIRDAVKVARKCLIAISLWFDVAKIGGLTGIL
jgi:hypothetical protein